MQVRVKTESRRMELQHVLARPRIGLVVVEVAGVARMSASRAFAVQAELAGMRSAAGLAAQTFKLNRRVADVEALLQCGVEFGKDSAAF